MHILLINILIFLLLMFSTHFEPESSLSRRELYIQVCYSVLDAEFQHVKHKIRRHFRKQMDKETKLRIHNITAKAALKFGSEALVLKKREEQRLEAAQMKFLRHLLGITKLDKEKNQFIREKTGTQSIVKEIK